MVNGVRRYPTGTDLQFPLNNQTVETIMKYNPEVYNFSKYTDSNWQSNVEVNLNL